MIISQEKMNNISFNEESRVVQVGPGVRLSDLNKHLLAQGYYIPFQQQDLDKRVFEVFNADQVTLSPASSARFQHLKDIISECHIVLSNGESLIVPNKVGHGMDLVGLFLGSNATVGLLAELKLRVQKLPRYYQVQEYVFANISDTQLYQLCKRLQ